METIFVSTTEGTGFPVFSQCHYWIHESDIFEKWKKPPPCNVSSSIFLNLVLTAWLY